MKSLWDDKEAVQYKDDLGLRVYTSRLLGRNPELVLHGGGNTSVKITEQDILGHEQQILYVKGSGWDLESIERPGFAPVRMDHLLELAKLDSLSDPQMVNELKTHMTDASAPAPSVETILHATLPYKFVDHTHADAIVTITNTEGGEQRIRDIFGDRVVVIPYVMPGFDLARVCAEIFATQANASTEGMVLMNHGIFSFADSAQESYMRMIDLVTLAEEYLLERRAWHIDTSVRPPDARLSHGVMVELAGLRKAIAQQVGQAVIMQTRYDARTWAFANRDDIDAISQRGPATPDHVIRTKRLPMLGRDVDAYCDSYRDYFEEHAPHCTEPKKMLDPAPRVILDKTFGLASIGRNAREAAIVQDIYMHTMVIIERACMLDDYKALPAADIFACEYWDLEQAKLKKSGKPPMFNGEVALVTGAASGIGRACVESLFSRGAAVIGLDINPDIASLYNRADFLGIVCDVANPDNVLDALQAGVERFGGLDILILNAGIFPASMRIDAMDMALWQKTLDINLSANLNLMHATYPLLKLAPNGGRVAVIGSKNVPAPGPGAAAYSASKAALNQLVRVAALEWGQDNIRINEVHPNAVFDTGLWTDEVLAARAKSYGMSVEQYKTRNLMRVEVSSHDVAELAVEMCGPLFAKTVAAQIPIDGGDERVI